MLEMVKTMIIDRLPSVFVSPQILKAKLFLKCKSTAFDIENYSFILPLT